MADQLRFLASTVLFAPLRHLFSPIILAPFLLSYSIAQGQAPSWNSSPISQLQWIEFGVVLGRITATPPHVETDFTAESANKRSGRTERLIIRVTSDIPAVRYEIIEKNVRLTIDITDGDTVRIVRTADGPSGSMPLEFEQRPSSPLTLRVGSGDSRMEVSAADLWQLWLVYPSLCRDQLLPYLHTLNPGWHLDTTAAQIERAMQNKAKEYQPPDRKSWLQAIEALSSDKYRARRLAEQSLRASGQTVLPFLVSISKKSLDSEQRHRVRRLVYQLSGNEYDSADRVATWLMPVPEVWLAFLNRDSIETRQCAKAQLERIFNEKVLFDPSASEPIRLTQIARLYQRLDPR